MPCYSEGPSQDEIDAGEMNALLDELDGKHAPGYDPDGNLDDWARHADQRPGMNNHSRARELCRRLRAMPSTRIKKLSLEMQIWWRDHQRFDRARASKKTEARRVAALRKSARAKIAKALTKAERTALRGVRL